MIIREPRKSRADVKKTCLVCNKEFNTKSTQSRYCKECKIKARNDSTTLMKWASENLKGGDNKMGLFGKKQEAPPVAPPIEIEEVGTNNEQLDDVTSEDSEEETELFAEDPEVQALIEKRNRLEKEVAELKYKQEVKKAQELAKKVPQTSPIEEPEEVNANELKEALINHEQRLQLIEAALFRMGTGR